MYWSYKMLSRGSSKHQNAPIVIPEGREESSSVPSITVRIVEDPSTSFGMTGLHLMIHGIHDLAIHGITFDRAKWVYHETWSNS